MDIDQKCRYLATQLEAERQDVEGQMVSAACSVGKESSQRPRLARLEREVRAGVDFAIAPVLEGGTFDSVPTELLEALVPPR